MTTDSHQKVQASHLKRNAYLYVRQSTLRQVFENTESTKRQYGLRQRAIALGWSEERIIVIDSDLRRFIGRPRGLPASGGRGRCRACRDRAWAGSVAPGTQFHGLASAARDLRHHRHPDPR